jgi:hypothetical protein
MESLKKGGRISRRKTKVKTKIKVKKTTKQTARGKNISQFKGTGAQVIVNVKNPISRAREQLQQSQSAGLSSVLPTILASQQASEGRMEQLIRQRDTVQQHMQHAQAQRANAVGTGHALAAEDADRVKVRRAAENRALEAQQRKLQEDILQVQQPATESRELASKQPPPQPQLSAEALRQQRIRKLGSGMLSTASEGLTSEEVSTRPPPMRKPLRSSSSESDAPTASLLLASGGAVPRPAAPSREDLQKRMRKETTEELRAKLVAHKEALGGRLAPSQRRIKEGRVSRIEAEIKKRVGK